jgi:hypothetical protein
MGWLQETMRTPGECHKMLQMNNEIFLDLHDALVERYVLQPSKYMNTYEVLEFFSSFVLVVSKIARHKIGSNTQVKLLVENFMRC